MTLGLGVIVGAFVLAGGGRLPDAPDSVPGAMTPLLSTIFVGM